MVAGSGGARRWRVDEQTAVEGVARQVRVALESADLEAFAQLLDPQVRWGPPGARPPPCRNRDQVLAWYRRGRQAGARAKVTEVVVEGDRIVVGLAVGNAAADGDGGGEVPRWQVLAVRAGRVVDIVGFEDREEALSHARA